MALQMPLAVPLVRLLGTWLDTSARAPLSSPPDHTGMPLVPENICVFLSLPRTLVLVR